MPEFLRQPQAVPRAQVDQMREALLRSPLVGRSTLAGSFRHSRGFAVTFTRAGLEELGRRFPMLEPFVPHLLAPKPVLRRWSERLFGLAPPTREANAFYLNLLLIPGGGSVGRHTDATLRGPSGDATALPERVSVLYLRVPPGARGGELRLYRDRRRVGRIFPEEGMVVHFRGDLQHEVTALSGVPEGALRMSLVCEQYALGAEALGRLAPVKVQSKAGFEGFVQHFREVSSGSSSAKD